MKIRPCIDIHNGAVKQIVGATLRDAPTGRAALRNDSGTVGPDSGYRSTASENFVSAKDAEYYASIYREKNLPGGHIILLNAAKDEKAYAADRRQAMKALAAYPGGMQIGGGITPGTAGDFLASGASHVVVTSYVFRDGRLDEERLHEMLRAVGREHLVLDLSCRRVNAPEEEADSPLHDAPKGPEEMPRYYVVTDRWQKFTDLEVCKETLTRLSCCCDEFLIHAADVEGKRAGIEAPLVRLLGAWQHSRIAAGLAPFPVTYAGGVHSLADITSLRILAEDTVDATVGSALDLFGGNLKLEDLVESARGPIAKGLQLPPAGSC